LFTDDDPLTFIEGDLRTFAKQQEAERAGHEAREALIRRMGRPPNAVLSAATYLPDVQAMAAMRRSSAFVELAAAAPRPALFAAPTDCR
jgi:hypothetical protein